MAFIVLAIGALLGLLTNWVDRMDLSWERRSGYKRMIRLAGEGYLSERRALRFGMPAERADGEQPTISCWVRRGRFYLDTAALRRLRTYADAGWDDHVQSRAPAPGGPRLLLRVKVGIWLPVIRPRIRARLVTLESGERRDHDLRANEDGLFDVSPLGLFA
ncbi:MAG: hypothetical protein ACJ75T_02745 [Solirubrobacterales bacterium]